ncbi:MAG: succinate dehydrogenase cytochrome b subunit [Saprospiraceae bacterium]|nr:succinate dehydrogenase cytochrome b subunit [Saprospiraceae bacterium]MBK7810545.1 succinate dehydrogenase cytochrome b subunit [Saprospiraceae bacterium]MBK9630134.1 succinate dehydrogenase cytochrome b subunit [Saprospiraceae bacterium]
MKWLIEFLFRSSIGQKIIMSLSGLFMILFLLIHLLGNLQLLAQDEGMSFNVYTYFMTHNPLIKTISYLLYATILLHSVQGIYLYLQNRKAKGKTYAVSSRVGDSFFSRYMMHLGIIILIFLIIHLWQFWLQMKLGNLNMVQYSGDDKSYKDLYTPVKFAFANAYYVLFYVLSMIVLAFHLWHGFHSAFQSLGLRHPKYSGLIRLIGYAYSIFIPLGFAYIPIFMFFNS